MSKLYGKKTKTQKEYVPQEGSGPYAILITLYSESLKNVDYLTKLDLIRLGQHLANASFTKPDPGSRYTAWSSMRTLISKNLVTKKSSPAKFSLTNEGLLLAKKLSDKQKRKVETKDIENDVCIDLSDEDVVPLGYRTKSSQSTAQQINDRTFQKQASSSSTISSDEDVIPLGYRTKSSQSAAQQINDRTFQKQASSSSTISSAQEDDVILSPDSFDIILYVDTSETRGNNINIHDDPILSKLRLLPVKYEVKSLKVGDYIWICRDRTTKKELVLPYIIERKRMDDFAKSIKDGRYHEQKFRLKRSGIQNVTYLIEKYGNSQFFGLPVTTLYQAATNTAIQDGFCIKFTESCKHTAKYLADFSLSLIKMFKSKIVVSCPKENLTEINLTDDLISLMTFNEFNKSSVKNKHMKVSDLFVKMLTQIKGMSVNKALAIVREFPTPATLREAYAQNPGVRGEKLLAQIRLDDYEKTIGPVLSRTVYQLFTMQTF